MSDRFGPAALVFYGIAARLLGWRPPDFWAATPAELIAALAPTGTPAPLERSDLTRMMEHEHG